jgi:hypothetical protein
MEDDKFKFTDGCFFNEQPIKEPETVIQEFYDIYDLQDVKIMLWRLFKGAMSSENGAFVNPDEEIGDVIFFIETFLMLNMAVYEL